MKLRNTISGDTYDVKQIAAVERESDELVAVYPEDLESDEWEVVEE